MDDNNLSKLTPSSQQFDLNSPTLVSKPDSLNISRTRYILPAASNNSHSERVLEIPEKCLDCDLINLIMEYLYSAQLSQFSQDTKFLALTQAAKFFEFVENLDGIYMNDAALVYPKYKIYLETKTKEKTAYKLFMFVGRVLRWARNQDAIGDTPKYWTSITKDTLNRIPAIPKTQDEPRQTISKSLQFEGIDDDVLLLSARAYASYFLDKSFQLREFIKAKAPEIFLTVTEISRDKGITDSGLTSALSRHSLQGKYNNLESNSYKNRLFELQRLLIHVLHKAPQNLVGFFPSIMVGSRRKDSLFKSILDELRLPTQSDWESMLKVGRPNYPFVNLLHPSSSEQIAMCYLLSSDRIQPSGIDKLKIDNFRVTNKSVQICNFNKSRSGKGFDTPVYKSNSPIFKVYSRWFEMLSSLDRECLLDREDHCIPLTISKLNHRIKLLTMKTLDWYAPLLMNGQPRTIAVSECPEVEAFVRAMDGKLGDRVDGARRIPNKASFLSVAQSRAMLEFEPIRGINSEVSGNLLAELSGHTLRTSRNIYKDRTDSNNIVRSGRMFSVDIAQNMEEMAHSAKALLNRTSIVELDEIEREIGFVRGSKDFSESLDAILEKAGTMGYEIGLVGEISGDTKTYVICTPLVAGLIQGEILHIRKHLSNLESENPYRFRIHNTRLLYLELVLEQFDSKMVVEGQRLLEQFNFPFPPLS